MQLLKIKQKKVKDMTIAEKIEHNKARTKKKSAKTREAHARGEWSMKELRRAADDLFSLYIRLRDADMDGMIQCCTCPKILPIKEMECGHYHSRTVLPLKFDHWNCHGQCHGCNDKRYGDGRKAEHLGWICRTTDGIMEMNRMTLTVVDWQRGLIPINEKLLYLDVIRTYLIQAVKEGEQIGFNVEQEYKALLSKARKIINDT